MTHFFAARSGESGSLDPMHGVRAHTRASVRVLVADYIVESSVQRAGQLQQVFIYFPLATRSPLDVR
jgi:hypothetical protein